MLSASPLFQALSCWIKAYIDCQDTYEFSYCSVCLLSLIASPSDFSSLFFFEAVIFSDLSWNWTAIFYSGIYAFKYFTIWWKTDQYGSWCFIKEWGMWICEHFYMYARMLTNTVTRMFMHPNLIKFEKINSVDMPCTWLGKAGLAGESMQI